MVGFLVNTRYSGKIYMELYCSPVPLPIHLPLQPPGCDFSKMQKAKFQNESTRNQKNDKKVREAKITKKCWNFIASCICTPKGVIENILHFSPKKMNF